MTDDLRLGSPAPSEVADDVPQPGFKAQSGPERHVGTGRVAHLLVLGDVIAVGLIVMLTGGRWSFAAAYLVGAVVWHRWGYFSRRFNLSVLDDAPVLTLGVVIGGVALHLISGRGVVGTLIDTVLLLGALLGARALSYQYVRSLRRQGSLRMRTVLVANARCAEEVRRRVEEHPDTGIELLQVLVTEGMDEPRCHEPGYQPSLPLATHNALVGTGASALIIFDPTMEPEVLAPVVRSGQRLGVRTAVVPGLLALQPRAADSDTIWGLPVQHLGPRPIKLPSRFAKRMLDVIGSSLALLLLGPMMLAVALAVRLEMGRGIIFSQDRVGLRGHSFTMLKFRSLPERGPDDVWGAAEHMEIGPVGRFIRRYSLDELPQLFNVLRGDMSLVGPRPEQTRFVQQLEEEMTGYELRHRVPVGLTGLAAVTGLRGNTSLVDRVYFDNLYIENWSLWLDLKIMARTIGAVVRGSGR